MRKITIDPITRLEGHGKITIFLNDDGSVANVYLQIPELRGFEKFCEGRPVEDMPQITQRICGVCPEAHHMAATKALDDMFNAEPTSTAKKIRELLYSAFYVTDHTTHFYILGGPDFIMGPDAPVGQRNILGVIAKVGMDLAGQVLNTRKENHWIIQTVGGRQIHPVFGLPGGVSKAISSEDRQQIEDIAKRDVEFAKLSLKVFGDIVLKNKAYVDMIVSDAFTHQTYYMGLVDDKNKVNFYDGKVRVVDPSGKEFAKYAPRDYLEHVAEHVEPWSYTKFPFLKKVGWKGFVDGKDSGVYRATPLSRLNAADGMSTPLAQEEYQKDVFNPGRQAGPSHAGHPLGAPDRAALRRREAAGAQPGQRNNRSEYKKYPEQQAHRGGGYSGGPLGTLTHHYTADEKGLIKKCNLIVGTTNNQAALFMSVKKAAEALIKPGKDVPESLLDQIEMAWRPYDPCMSCSTHTLPGTMPLEVRVVDAGGNVVKILSR